MPLEPSKLSPSATPAQSSSERPGSGAGGGRDRQAESPNNHVHNSFRCAGKPPVAGHCFPVFLDIVLTIKGQEC